MKALAVVVILGLLALFCVDKGAKVEVYCGPHTSTPPMEHALDLVKGAGDLLHGLDAVTDSETVHAVREIVDAWIMWRDLFKARARGEDEPPAVGVWRERIRDAKAAAIEGCAVKCNSGTSPDGTTPPVAPGPPIDAISLRQSGPYTAEQRSIAATAVRVGQSMGVDPYGFVVILAAGFQESGIRNLSYGDRDSVGWLQQRAGWGTVAQRRDPAYAARKFFEHLKRVRGWQSMSVTQAAQAVQISAYPNAYAKWEDDAKNLLGSIAPDLRSALPRVDGNWGDQQEANPDCTVPNLRVGTWNIMFANDQASIEAGLAELGRKVDVIGGQEFTRQYAFDAARKVLRGWTIIGADGRDPIFLAPGLKVLPGSSGSVINSVATANIEGPPSTARPMTWVTILDRGGRPVSIVNTHLLNDIESHGKVDPTKPRRVAVWLHGLKAFAAKMRELATRGPVVGTGDFNAVPSNPTLQQEMAGFTPNTSASLGGRAVDIVWAQGPAVSVETLDRDGSDHRKVAASFMPGDTSSNSLPGTVRTVRDPSSDRVYRIPIPAGKTGVAMNAILDQLGKPYVWAAKGPNAFDCSGLMYFGWKKAGVDVYPQTEVQWRQEPHVSTWQPGDLVGWPGHVQMYLGQIDGQDLIVEAPRPGKSVQIVPEYRTPTRIMRPTAQEV